VSTALLKVSSQLPGRHLTLLLAFPFGLTCAFYAAGPAAETTRFFGPPAILFYDSGGAEIKPLRVLGEMDLEQFSKHLDNVEQAVSS
jgi:hypothetical protein